MARSSASAILPTAIFNTEENEAENEESWLPG